MKKLLFTMVLLAIASSSFAGCFIPVRNQISEKNRQEKRAIVLIDGRSDILAPGEDSMAYGGEYFNPTKKPVEVFFAREATGYDSVYYAVLANPETCKVITLQFLSDDL